MNKKIFNFMLILSLYSTLSWGGGGGISGGTPRLEQVTSYLNVVNNFYFSPSVAYFALPSVGNVSKYTNFNRKRIVMITPLKNTSCPISTMDICLVYVSERQVKGFKKLRENEFVQIEIMTTIEGDLLEQEFEQIANSIKRLEL